MRTLYTVLSTCLLIFLFLGVLHAQWTPVGLFPGGHVIAVLIVGDTVYAAINRFAYSNDGSIYRSTDEGATWKSLGVLGDIQCVAKCGPRLIVGTRYGAGICTSINEGETWQYPGIATESIVRSIAVRDSVVFAGGNGYDTFLSTDGGFSWARKVYPSAYGWGTNNVAIADSYIFAITNGYPYKLIRSQIDSPAWTILNPPFLNRGIIFSSGSKIFGSDSYHLFSSIDYGESWDTLGFGLPEGWYPHAFCMVEDTMFALIGDNIYYSSNIGVPWQLLSYVPYDADLTVLATNNKLLVVGTAGSGIYISGDRGATWDKPSIVVPASLTSLLSTGEDLLVGTSGGIYRSNNNGDNWIPSRIGMNSASVSAISSNSSAIFAATWLALFHSTDTGRSWTSPSLSFNYCENVHAIGNWIFVNASGDGEWTTPSFAGVSTDGGDTWTSVDSLAGFWEFASSDSAIFAGSGRNMECWRTCAYPPPEWGVYKSRDKGTTWESTSFPVEQVSALAVQGEYVATASIGDSSAHQANYYLSTNNGDNWQKINGGIVGDGQSLQWIGNDLFAATTGGIFRLRSNDTSWSPLNDGLTDSSAKALTVHDDYLFLIGNGSTIWRRPVSEITGIVNGRSLNLPKSFSLDQNYPNPFNPTTTISYQLPTQSYVTLKVFDVLGREVAMLVNGVEEPGYKSVQFDASRLSSSIYFYRLQADNYIETKKLLLIR